MQARAIFEAAVQVAKKGVKVIAEVMIPLIGSVEEFSNQEKIVVDVAEEVLGKAGMQDLKYLVGTMIEIPRAALTDWLNSGEPSSVQFCYCVDMNYVSCSPYRVPIARLAAAHAAISGDKSEAMRTA
jgi:phosphoenolpyruvate synthase/pyruvate phosphate dikinase